MRARASAVAAVVAVVAASTAAAGATLNWPTPLTRAADATVGFVPERGRFYLTNAEVALMRKNVSRERWARMAWKRVRAAADSALASSPQPASPTRDYGPVGTGPCGDGDDGWRDCLYGPGRIDGHRARDLALAYAVTGDRRYADKSKTFLLAWARTYTPLPRAPSHNVAEPVGFMLKAFMAYDLVRNAFTRDEKNLFRAWAAQFVERGMQLADAARDRPWIPEAPYGNGATWPRALAVLAAAVVGGRTLEHTLDWNWQHATDGGREYGWMNLLGGVMEPSGKMTEERVRQSVTYGLYTWVPMALIADVAAHAGLGPSLWAAKTRRGAGMFRPVAFYAPYLMRTKTSPYETEVDSSYEAKLAEYRAVMELAHKAYPRSAVARAIVQTGGDTTRGSNYDPHITGWNALTGR